MEIATELRQVIHGTMAKGRNLEMANSGVVGMERIVGTALVSDVYTSIRGTAGFMRKDVE